MKVIKCDICGGEVDFDDVSILNDFTNPCENIDLCKKCLSGYRDLESSFKQDRKKIHNEYAERMETLINKYRKDILKYKERID